MRRELCRHRQSRHTPRCTAVDVGEFAWGTQLIDCDCPGFEPPEDEEND